MTAFRDYVLAAAANIPGVRTQADIARTADLNPAMVSKWFRGREQPHPESLERLATALGVPFTDLAVLAGRIPNPNPGHTPTPPTPRTIHRHARALDEIFAPDSPIPAEDQAALESVLDTMLSSYMDRLRTQRGKLA